MKRPLARPRPRAAAAAAALLLMAAAGGISLLSPRPDLRRLEEEELVAGADGVLAERLRRVRETCRRRGLEGKGTVMVDNGYGMLVDTKHRIAYCENAKTGSTTWKRHFLGLSDLTPFERRKMESHFLTHKMADRRFNPLRNALFRNVSELGSYVRENGIFLFSFVRHPFERLVSAFENKILYRKDPVYDKLAARLRSNFSAFASHVLLEASSAGCNLTWCDVDHHWMPFVPRCAFCSLRYDMVGKTETFSDDVGNVLRLSGLSFPSSRSAEEAAVLAAGLRSNVSPGRGDDHGDDGGRAKTARYFSQLDAGARTALYELYKLDFEMFGYSASEYL